MYQQTSTKMLTSVDLLAQLEDACKQTALMDIENIGEIIMQYLNPYYTFVYEDRYVKVAFLARDPLECYILFTRRYLWPAVTRSVWYKRCKKLDKISYFIHKAGFLYAHRKNN